MANDTSTAPFLSLLKQHWYLFSGKTDDKYIHAIANLTGILIEMNKFTSNKRNFLITTSIAALFHPDFSTTELTADHAKLLSTITGINTSEDNFSSPAQIQALIAQCINVLKTLDTSSASIPNTNLQFLSVFTGVFFKKKLSSSGGKKINPRES
jgi:hypothetical protein